MSYVTVEVDIDRGNIVPRQPEKLPETATGLLTIFTPSPTAVEKRERILALELLT